MFERPVRSAPNRGGLMGAVFGKYQLIAQLGEGGMAQVYLAALAGPRGSGFSKLTVIKRLRASYEEDQEFITMLVDEARIAARLNHPNLIQTHEVGDVDGRYFIAMEYLDGQPYHRLQARLRTLAKNGVETGFTKEMGYVILLDVLAGLHHAHELKDYDGTPFSIVHRDVSPQNIFITYDGHVKVVDFGIAKAAGRGSETQHGVVKGKLRYMAPEQAVSSSVSRQTDLFAVGLLLWEIVTGRPRWKDQSEGSILRALLADEAFIPPSEIDPSTPREIETILRKALALKPEDRYATAEDFRRDLEQYALSTGKLQQSRAELSALLAQLFKEQRDELRAVIEKALAKANNGSSELTPMMLTLHTEAGRGDKRGSVSSQISAVSQPSGGRGRTFIMVLLAAAVIVVVGGVLASRDQKGSHAASNAPAPPVSVEQVDVSITTVPTNARLFVDGVRVAPPYDGKHNRGVGNHTVIVEADGYEPQTKTVLFDQNVSLNVALVKTATTSPPPVPPAPPPANQGKVVVASPPRATGVRPAVPAAPDGAPASTPAHPPTPSPPSTDLPASGKRPLRQIDPNDPYK
jgi:eukaryotic-like serine/threonine-protein kinase